MFETLFEDYNFNVSSKRQNLYIKAFTRYNSWFLTGHPWIVLIVVSCYLFFVLKLGPEFMKHRQPMNIRNIIIVYNLFQTLMNTYLLSKLFTTKGALHHLIVYACYPMERSINPYCELVTEVFWWFLFLKITDLLDTIFFILRKKQSHVTFLHVYHHTDMVLLTFFYNKYFHTEQAIIPGIINTFVHVIMYGYYFLAALGPQMQKYLWWKIYVTKLQMLQFVVILLYVIALPSVGCHVPIHVLYLGIFQAGIFLILFANFYFRTYFPKKMVKNIPFVNENESKNLAVKKRED